MKTYIIKETLTIDFENWIQNEMKNTYYKGQDDLMEILPTNLSFDEETEFIKKLARKAYEDADETGTDEMRFFIIYEQIGEAEALQYWKDIHTIVTRIEKAVA